MVRRSRTRSWSFSRSGLVAQFDDEETGITQGKRQSLPPCPSVYPVVKGFPNCATASPKSLAPALPFSAILIGFPSAEVHLGTPCSPTSSGAPERGHPRGD